MPSPNLPRLVPALAALPLLLLSACVAPKGGPKNSIDWFVPLDDAPESRSGEDPAEGDASGGGDSDGDSEARPPIPRWAAELTVATLTENHTHAPLRGRFDAANGDTAGKIYEGTLVRTLGEMDLVLGGNRFRPRWEVPFTLGIVDERSSKTFFTYSLALAIRWVDFPWNEYLPTSVSMGGGLIYTSNILKIDRARNRGRRSQVKFHWPIQLAVALPQYPQYQWIFFSDHSSGGETLDVGGFDNWGFGLRFTF